MSLRRGGDRSHETRHGRWPQDRVTGRSRGEGFVTISERLFLPAPTGPIRRQAAGGSAERVAAKPNLRPSLRDSLVGVPAGPALTFNRRLRSIEPFHHDPAQGLERLQRTGAVTRLQDVRCQAWRARAAVQRPRGAVGHDCALGVSGLDDGHGVIAPADADQCLDAQPARHRGRRPTPADRSPPGPINDGSSIACLTCGSLMPAIPTLTLATFGFGSSAVSRKPPGNGVGLSRPKPKTGLASARVDPVEPRNCAVVITRSTLPCGLMRRTLIRERSSSLHAGYAWFVTPSWPWMSNGCPCPGC